MTEPIRLLVAGDAETAAGPLRDALRQSGLMADLRHVATSESVLDALDEPADVVIVIHRPPAVNGLPVLTQCLARYPDIPCVVVSSRAGEDAAVEVMKLGAADVVIDDRVSRLGPAVRDAIARRTPSRRGDWRGSRHTGRSTPSEAEDRLNLLVQFMPVAIGAIDTAGNIATWNAEAERITGYRAEEIVGSPGAWERLFPEREYRKQLLAEWRQRGNAYRDWKWRVIRKDGSRRTVAWYSVGDRCPVEGWAAWGIGIDLTEELALQERALHAQKLESISRLAGGVAHDFNNILTAILGYVELAIYGLPEGDATRPLLEEVRTAGERAADLTAQLLAFAGRQRVAPTRLELGGVVAATLPALRRLAGHHIEIVAAGGDGAGYIDADADQLQQVLTHLTVNARDAMPDGGRLVIETSTTRIDGEPPQAPGTLAPGDYVVLRVSDTGEGISREAQEHIFEPFYTTKPKGRGTGLGLATCHGIVRRHGGHIDVSSGTGRGTTFRIFFPRVAKSEGTTHVVDAGALRGGTEVVLVAEDEPAVRSLAARALRAVGYEVVEAEDGLAGVERAREMGARLQLLVTDIVMPGMRGDELADEVRLVCPGVKTLFMSGHTDGSAIASGVGSGSAFLAKPFTPEALARLVRDLLDGGRTSEAVPARSPAREAR
jgi:PAS domain S-box-containing protein